LVETYEAQSCIENGKVAKANVKIMDLETESKKARNHYNERMKEQEKLRASAEKEKKGVEKILTEKGID